MSDVPPFLSVDDLARRWRVSRQTVKRRIAAGDLAAVLITPHALRVRAQDVEAYEQQRALEATAA